MRSALCGNRTRGHHPAIRRPWNIGEITRFILFIGPISSIFEYTTFFVMLWVFKCWDPSRASVFQTGWFVESLMTQTLVIYVIRTNRIPFLQSRASWLCTPHADNESLVTAQTMDLESDEYQMNFSQLRP
jgi:magnesium-transporting ATPase (P-type)